MNTVMENRFTELYDALQEQVRRRDAARDVVVSYASTFARNAADDEMAATLLADLRSALATYEIQQAAVVAAALAVTTHYDECRTVTV